MPGIEYQGRNHDNIFHGTVEPLALELGVGVVAPWVIDKTAGSVGRTASGSRYRGGDISSHKWKSKKHGYNVTTYGWNKGNSQGQPRGPASTSSFYNDRVRKIQGRQSVHARQFAKSLRSFGRVFGFLWAGQVGYDIVKGIAASGASAITNDTEVMMSRQQVNHESGYFDSRKAFTQRQRSLQVLHNSRLSLKPALGNEASFLHN